VEGLFRSGLGNYNCDIEHNCIYMQDEQFSVPMYLYAEMEQNVMKDLTTSIQVPGDINQDFISNTK
jgi:hypothetical protein